ncbi:TetR family transcriptional regulator [Pseudoclavibacter alba]|nr:TetR family transcriptional regulator [Pseudoclavibacter alba]
MREHMARTRGRPALADRAQIDEAAAELFLEQGYEATSVDDIARRAGVARSSFFNRAASKAELLWTSVDHWLGVAEGELLGGSGVEETALERIASLCDRIPDEDKPWAIVHRDAMGTRDALLAGVGPRLARYEQLLVRLFGGTSTANTTRAQVLMAVVATRLAGERWVSGNGVPLGVHLREVCRELGLADLGGTTGG